MAIVIAGIYCLPQGPEKLEYIMFKVFGVEFSPVSASKTSDELATDDEEIKYEEDVENEEVAERLEPVKTEEKTTVKAKPVSKLHANRAKVQSLIGENYLDAVLSAGKLERWNPRSFPLRVYFHGANVVPPTYVREAKNAFATWEKSTKGFVKFVYTDSPENAHYVCNFVGALKNRNCDSKGAGTAAYQYFTYDDAGNIKHSIVEFSPYSCSGYLWPAEVFYSTALHEIGHGLGLRGHSTNPNDLMYPSSNSVKRERISDADMTTLRAIYSIIPDTTNIPFSEADKKGLISTEDFWGNESQRADFTIKQIEDNIRITPNNPSLYLQLARACQDKKYYQCSIDAYSSALKKIDNREHAYAILIEVSLLYMEIGKFSSAEKCIDKAATYTSDSIIVQAYNELAAKYIDAKEYNKAARIFDKAILAAKTDEDRKLIYHNYCYLAYLQKDKVLYEKYDKLLNEF